MSPIAIGFLAVSMSVDAFVASLGQGATAKRPNFSHALRTGVLFGVIEALTPLIGWALGVAASQYVQAFDHWIAFTLLGAVGLRMVLQALRAHDDAPQGRGSLWALIATAIGTSIDAMVVGVSLAFLDVNILLIALAIGLATMTMSTTGVLAGRFLGNRLGRIVEVFGGLALIVFGTTILIEHLSMG
ncbi:manganese efflux pump MntP family protein [Paracoccus sp. (in: a-proteobacteria)]|uniref:manganese efflux pump MntP n=1 Tax=Paracoccus sp. TaxID=267 RepID=UPI00289F3B65|nr:manganese efflux pump MntP family protein [Paracoccus sp. (in: a-proteobacteria)]